MKRQRYIGHGMKMYLNCAETRAWCEHVREHLPQDRRTLVFFLPQFTCLHLAKDVLGDTDVMYGGQNMCWEPRGAFTGEVSAETLVGLGCTFVELGHQERRQYFQETDAIVNKKTATALEFGLQPIVCIGEEERPSASGLAKEHLREQIATILHGLGPEEVVRIIFAYEPRWAIGVSEPADPGYVAEMAAFIREVIAELTSGEAADRCHILYGGSLSRETASEYLALLDIDGLFVGRGALNPENFVALVELSERTE